MRSDDIGRWLNILCDMSLQALEKAKEASRKERTLVRQREQSDKADQINIDLYGSVSKAGVHHLFLVKGDSQVNRLLILYNCQF